MTGVRWHAAQTTRGRTAEIHAFRFGEDVTVCRRFRRRRGRSVPIATLTAKRASILDAPWERSKTTPRPCSGCWRLAS